MQQRALATAFAMIVLSGCTGSEESRPDSPIEPEIDGEPVAPSSPLAPPAEPSDPPAPQPAGDDGVPPRGGVGGLSGTGDGAGDSPTEEAPVGGTVESETAEPMADADEMPEPTEERGDDPASGSSSETLGIELAPLDLERFTAENVAAALETIVALHAAAPLTDRLRELRRLERDMAAPGSRFERLSITEPGFNRVLLCPDGGRVSSNLESVDDPLAGAGHSLNRCAVEGSTYSGTFAFLPNREDGDIERRSITFGSVLPPMTIGRADGSIESVAVLGVRETTLRDRAGETALGFSISNAAMTIARDERVTTLSYALTEYGRSSIPGVRPTPLSPAADATYQRATQVSLELPSGTLVQSIVATPFVAERGTESFGVGQLEVSVRTARGGGNRLTMSADNGDPDTFDVLIFDDDITVQSFAFAWSDRYRFVRPATLLD